MSKWTKIRIVFGITGSIFAILVVVLVVNIGSYVNRKYEQTKLEQVVNDKNTDNKLNMDDDFINIVYRTIKINSNWSNLPLSKNFKKKFNAKNGILNDNTITDIYGGINSNKEKQIVVLNIKHGLKDEEYYIHYTVNENNELDDVEIVGKKLLYDENGNKIIYKESISEENYEDVLIKLADPYNINHAELETDFYNLTENYISKWSGGFVNSRGFDYYSRYIIKELSSFKKRIVYMKCEYPKFDNNGDIIDIDEELTLYYKVKFFMNTDLWLDDVEVEEVSKEEIDMLLNAKTEDELP